MKRLFIAEKPSVAQQFAQVLHVNARKNGYLESDEYIVTWCVGHLVTMSYPDAYDPSLKKWAYDTIPFVPDEFKYEVINNVKKQFDIVCSLLNREDVSTIYVCTDSGREGEYIYRLVDQMANVGDKKRRDVCGLIPRQRKKSSVVLRKQSCFQSMIIYPQLPTFVPRKII